MELNAIATIHKYKGFQEGHLFILMVMEVHDVPRCDMNYFIMECARLFHNKQSKGHLSLFFCIQFFKQQINISFQRVLTSVIKRKITLAGDVCFRPPITIKFHDLHVSDIKGAMGEITSYHERD
jgi:hypothetical protein